MRDPLWLLTRQWQLGEFEGDDAGSPVSSQMLLERTELTELGAREQPVTAFEGTLPLETRVERRPFSFRLGGVPLALDLRLALGRRWEKLLAASVAAGDLTADYTDVFREAFQFPSPDPDSAGDAGLAAHPDVWQAFAAVSGKRALDGGALYERLDGNATAPAVRRRSRHRGGRPRRPRHAGRPVGRLVPRSRRAGRRTRGRRLGPAAAGVPLPRGRPRTRTARRGVTPPTSTTAGGWTGGTSTWMPTDATPLDQPAPGVVVETMSASVPSPVSFEGMPATRWWAFEDGRTNLGAVDAATTDIATMLFVEFALVFANDWFLTQLPMPVGSIAKVRGLAVTNVFGERYLDPAGRRRR